MTRGTLVLFLPDKVLKSIEFNGDMGRFGHYKEAIKILADANSRGEFEYGLEMFNNLHFQYEYDVISYKKAYGRRDELEKEGITFDKDIIKVELVDNYFERWFSDYIFFKNMSGRTIKFSTINEGVGGREIYEIKHGEIFVSYFGKADAQVSAAEPNKIIDWGILLGHQKEKI